MTFKDDSNSKFRYIFYYREQMIWNNLLECELIANFIIYISLYVNIVLKMCGYFMQLPWKENYKIFFVTLNIIINSCSSFIPCNNSHKISNIQQKFEYPVVKETKFKKNYLNDGEYLI